MRKLIPLVISVSLTFTLGVSLSMLWTYHSPTQVTLCMLARNPGAYHQKEVQVRASATVISDQLLDFNPVIVGDPGCAEVDGWASIEVDESYNPSAEVEAFINSPKQEIRKAEIIVVGQFDQAATTGCFAPKFAIVATSIQLVSPVSSEPLLKIPQHP